MKQLFTLMLCLIGLVTCAQNGSPAGFNYQAVIRDAGGEIKANKPVEITFNLKTDVNGEIHFTETHQLTTNEFGLVNVVIGSVNQEALSNLNYSTIQYHINILVDGVDVGTTQLVSVPYSLQANTSLEANFAENAAYSNEAGAAGNAEFAQEALVAIQADSSAKSGFALIADTALNAPQVWNETESVASYEGQASVKAKGFKSDEFLLDNYVLDIESNHTQAVTGFTINKKAIFTGEQIQSYSSGILGSDQYFPGDLFIQTEGGDLIVGANNELRVGLNNLSVGGDFYLDENRVLYLQDNAKIQRLSHLANLLPTGYGMIFSNGQFGNSSGNLTLTKTGTGNYSVGIDDVSISSFTDVTVTAQPVGHNPGVQVTYEVSNGKINFRTYNASSQVVDAHFSFVIHKP